MLVINVYICPGDSYSSRPTFHCTSYNYKIDIFHLQVLLANIFFLFFFSTSSKYEATLAFFVLCFLGDLMNIQSPFTVALYLSPQTP